MVWRSASRMIGCPSGGTCTEPQATGCEIISRGFGEWQLRPGETRAHPVGFRSELIDFVLKTLPRRFGKPMLLHPGNEAQLDAVHPLRPSDMPVAAAGSLSRFAEIQPVARPQRPPVEAAESRAQVGGHASQHLRHPQSAGHREAGADAARQLGEIHGFTRRHAPRFAGRSGQGDHRFRVKLEDRAASRRFPRPPRLRRFLRADWPCAAPAGPPRRPGKRRTIRSPAARDPAPCVRAPGWITSIHRGPLGSARGEIFSITSNLVHRHEPHPVAGLQQRRSCSRGIEQVALPSAPARASRRAM